jgi:hypothetical protein
METEVTTLQLPTSLFNKLQTLAEEAETDPVEIIARLVTLAFQQQGWRRNLNVLREQIQQEGGLQVGLTKDEVVERLRQTRQEIFEAEYAHLY